MNNLYARCIFFVQDAEPALRFYTEQLGFTKDWQYPDEGAPFVFQVSLMGFELIVNQVDQRTQSQAGHGRLFIGLDDDQVEPLHNHIAAKGIPTERRDWGRSTLVLKDLDGNELYFWDLPQNETPAP